MAALHPDVEPQFYIGAIVLYDDAPHQVIGRSIAADGTCTYIIHPCEGVVAHLDTRTQSLHTFPLDNPLARSTANDPGHAFCVERAQVTRLLDAEPIAEVAEADIEAFRPEHESVGVSTRDYHVTASAGNALNEAGRATDRAAVQITNAPLSLHGETSADPQ